MSKRLENAHQATDLIAKWECMIVPLVIGIGMTVPHDIVERWYERVEQWWSRRFPSTPPRDGRPCSGDAPEHALRSVE